MPKKILIFSLAYFPVVGGAEVAVKEITDRVSAEEIEFDMVTMRFSRKHPAFERVGKVNVYRLGLPAQAGGGLGYLSKILFIPQSAIFALRRKYDLLWCLMTYMTFPVSLMRLVGNRTPYIITLQDGDPFEHVFERARIRLFSPLLRYAFTHAYKIQTISNFLADWANRLGYPGKPEVIPNGVEVKKFEVPLGNAERNALRAELDFEPEDTVLITTSRLVEKNGVGDVIEALKYLPEEVKFLILGVGPLEESLRQKARELGVERRVRFLGFVAHDELPKYLKSSDIFIRASLSEGMGNSFIEAMAASIPVIATPVGGIPDFLFDPDKDHDMPATGLFVEPHNPRIIAHQVQRLLTNLVLRDKLVINAKRMVVEKYDWDIVAESMKNQVFKPSL